MAPVVASPWAVAATAPKASATRVASSVFMLFTSTTMTQPLKLFDSKLEGVFFEPVYPDER
jgi:hypothetical protein